MLKHLESYKMPSGAHMTSTFSVPPTMQAVIVDCVPIVQPELASVIGNDAESVMTGAEDSVATCPTHSKVIVSMESRPFTTCVPIVYQLTPSRKAGPTTVHVRTTTTLAEVECILHEDAMAVVNWISSVSPAGMLTVCTCDPPSISSVTTLVSEKHASMAAVFKHFNSHHAPATNTPSSFAIAPTM
jgi:hypothetical protein